MSQLPVKVKKLNELAQIPNYATDGSAGLDLVATSEHTVFDGAVGYTEYGTSLAFEIPEGFMGLLFPRSSISSNTSLVLANSVGVIDSDYRNEVKVRFKNITLGAGRKYRVGDKVAQLIIVPYPKIKLEEVVELNDTVRGLNGFGSSGR